MSDNEAASTKPQASKFTPEEKAAHAARVKEREAAKKERQRLKKAKKAEERAAAGAPESGGDAAPKKKGKKRKAAPAPPPPAKPAGGHKTYDATLLKKAKGDYDGPLSPPYEVFLKYLPPDATEAQVEAFFAGCGALALKPKLMRDHKTGRVIRGFVRFADEAGIRAALRRDLARLGGRSVSVTVATTCGTMQASGTHTPAMFEECVEALGVAWNPDGVYVDGTFGRGGHTRKILEKLGPKGTLHGFDMDPEAVAVGEQLNKEDPRFVIHHAPFSSMAAVLAGVAVDGVLLDIGISSPQLDGGRGFKPEVDGPLDMRFDVREGVEDAMGYLKRASRVELAAALEAYGGERPAAARRIADAVALAKKDGSLSRMTTRPFADLVERAKGKEYQAMHPAKMTFQALRIVVNREYLELERGLAGALEVLKEGCAVAVLTWKHSECQVVVDFQTENAVAAWDAPLAQWHAKFKAKHAKNAAKCAVDEAAVGCAVDDARRPSDAEIQRNSRSRSALLHVTRKATGPRLADLERVAAACLGWDDHDRRAPPHVRAAVLEPQAE